MEAYEAIVTRRSIRKYTEKPIDEQTVRKLLEAGMQAPSAVNKQPWHFVVIDDRRILDAIPDVHPHAPMLRHAPLAIVVCADPALANGPGYVPQDCSAATENILLAAHALGLGAVWLGVYSNESREAGVRRILGIPADMVPFSIVSIGHPAEQRDKPERYREDRIHRNHW